MDAFLESQPLLATVLTVLISSTVVLAVMVVYYRLTYGGITKCRWCRAVGEEVTVSHNKVCSRCNRRHVRDEAFTDVDRQAIEDHKKQWVKHIKESSEVRHQNEIAAKKRESKKHEREHRLLMEAKELEAKNAQKQAVADQKKKEKQENALAAFRMQEARMLDLIQTGSVVVVRQNLVNAKSPEHDGYLQAGDLIQVAKIAKPDTRHAPIWGDQPQTDYHAVYYKRLHGKSKMHWLPLVDVVPYKDHHLYKNPTCIRIKGKIYRYDAIPVASDNIADCHQIHADPIMDKADYIEPGDTVRVLRNEVQANRSDNNGKLVIGDEVKVSSVLPSGSDAWPKKSYDVLTYKSPGHSQGLNYLPLYDVELVRKHHETV